MIRIDSYELIIVALRDPVAADVRLRRVLKSLLRTYRFRCKSVRPVESQPKRAPKQAVKRLAHKSRPSGRAMAGR